jgi:hypothetical protein
MWKLSERAVSAYPGTIFSTEYMEEHELVRALMDHAIDLAILTHPLALPTITVRQIMTESLFVEAPATSDLAGRDHVTWEDLNGRPFLVLESIGFWMDVVRENLPDSQIIVQQDSTILSQLIASSDILNFATEASGLLRPRNSRMRIPIWGTGATTTFFAACMNDATPQVRRVLDLFDSTEMA